MKKLVKWPRLGLLTIFFSLSLWSHSGGDTYIVEKSIDVLTVAKNFKKSKTLAASKNGQMTVLRRVPNSDPKWWPGGVAIEVLSIAGKEVRPVETVYVAKKWFERGTRKGEVAALPDPVQVQQQVDAVLAPNLQACEVEVNEPVLPVIEPIYTKTDTYSILSDLVKTTNSSRSCHNALKKWYRENSMWKDISRKERAKKIVLYANDIAKRMRFDGLVDSCVKALGLSSKEKASNYFSYSLSDEELDGVNVTNYEKYCSKFAAENGHEVKTSNYFKERTRDPSSIHPQFASDLAICIIKRETSSTNFDPHSMNYSFCEAKGRQGKPRSTAHGLAQFTQTTFLSLRDSGLMPLANTKENATKRENRVLFRQMSTKPEMQIESIFHYINYLMKAPGSARIRNMHDQVYNDSFQDWEKAVISYDQDRASNYIRGVHACRRCIAKAGDDIEAQANCLEK